MCCDLNDFDNESLDERWQRARKAHRCYACREMILLGHRYHVVANLTDGVVETIRHCARCWSICNALWHAGIEAVRYDLNCGEVWADPPGDIAALAFLSPADAQALWP